MQDHESVYGSRVASCIDTLHVLVSGILNCCAYFKRRFLAIYLSVVTCFS